MKKVLMICLLFFIVETTYSQTENNTIKVCEQISPYDRINKDISSAKKLIQGHLYYSAYSTILSALEIVEDKKQMNSLISLLKELKKECKVMPESECASLKKQIDEGKHFPKETLFFYDCEELMKDMQ